MRDDIHKNAPVPPEWRWLIRAAARDADWSENVAPRARDAVRAEVHRDLDESLVAEVTDAVLERQRHLFGTGARLRELEHGRTLSELERRFLDHLNRLGRASFDRAAVRMAIIQTVEDRIAANLREIEGHVARSYPSARSELMRRLRVGAKQVSPSELADRLLRGERLSRSKAKVRLIDVDGEDLRKRASRR